MSESNNHINYSAADIEQYRQGKLLPAAMHAMEKAALNDPFLSDAMEGYGRMNEKPGAQSSAADDLQDLQTRLIKRVTDGQSAPVIKFSWWKIAAAVFLLAGASWFYLATNSKVKLQSVATSKTPAAEKTDSVAGMSAEDSQQLTAAAKPSRGVVPVPGRPANKVNTTRAAAPVALADKSLSDRREKSTDTAADKASLAETTVTGKPALNRVVEQLKSKSPGVSVQEQYNNNHIAGNINSAPNTFTGTLVDESNRPLVNAIIQIPNLNIATTTNNQGNFSFRAPDTTLKISVASAGYETQNIDLANNRIENTENIIRLKPSLPSTKDVVVSGDEKKTGNARKEKNITINILDAVPSVNMNDYDQYIKKNKKIPEELKNIHGEVTVSFTVDIKSYLHNFRIEKSLEDNLDEEAIRLIKEGPSWKLLKGKKARASFTVVF